MIRARAVISSCVALSLLGACTLVESIFGGVEPVSSHDRPRALEEDIVGEVLRGPDGAFDPSRLLDLQEPLAMEATSIGRVGPRGEPGQAGAAADGGSAPGGELAAARNPDPPTVPERERGHDEVLDLGLEVGVFVILAGILALVARAVARWPIPVAVVVLVAAVGGTWLLL